MISGKRISQTWIGYIIIVFLFTLYALLLTSSATGEWFSYFLPSCAGVATLLFFVGAILLRAKLPQLPSLSWISIGGIGGYFFARAWFSPDFYGSIQDMLPMAFALMFYIMGIFIGFSRSTNRILFVAFLIFIGLNTVLLNDIFLFNKDLVVGRPSQSMLLYPLGSTGTFGYENFTAHFLVSSAVFCVAYFIFAGMKSWPWLIIALIAYASATQITGARSVMPNMIIGGIICWLFVLYRFQAKTKIFVALSILSVLGLLIFAGSTLSIITQQVDNLGEITSNSNSAGRFLFLAMTPQIADSAPWIGHGSQSFPHMALPLMPMGMMPNMAHNEYAQAIVDYGWIGLSLMLTLLISHLILGVKLILQKSILPEHKAIYIAAFSMLFIMFFHAAFDFIWHNGALASNAGLCLGILSTSRTNQVRAGSRINNYSLLVLSIVLGICLLSFCKISFPIWKLSWEMNELPTVPRHASIGNISNIDPHLALLDQAVTIAGDPEQTDKLAHVILESTDLSTRKNCEKLISQLINSINHSPQDDLLKTSLGQAYDNIGEFEKAEALLYPYSHPRYYMNQTYPWKGIYMKHLMFWASSKMGRDNATALSLLLEMERIEPLQRFLGIQSKKQRELIKNLLLKQGVKPDDSWKKSRTPSEFPTSYGPSLPGLVPPHP